MAHNLFSEKFTSHLKHVLARAHVLAASARAKHADAVQHNEKTTSVAAPHILEAIMQERGSIAAEIIVKASTKKDSIPHRQASSDMPPTSYSDQSFRLSENTTKAIVRAVRIAYEYGHKYVGTEHMLKSLTELNTADIAKWFKTYSVEARDLEKNLTIVLESTSKFPDLTAVFKSQHTAADTREAEQTALEYFGRELTDEMIQRDIDPLIGRDQEVAQLVRVLCRRYKNNPVLLGDAGVGKTAIIEGLAKKITQGDVPPILAQKKIYAVDLGSMVAGTVYRGEFEARLKNLVETAESQGNVILFIDEIHTVTGAGSASGSLDAANMLKPALARGKISVIGATTVEEYKKHLESDSALDRRFQPIFVSEPNEKETREVLAGIRKNYESFHNVRILDETIDAAVKLSNRYISNKLQPDKAIDLIDEAAAKIKVARSEKSSWKEIRNLESELASIVKEKNEAVSKELYKQAIVLKQEEDGINARIKDIKIKTTQEAKDAITVTPNDIIEIVSAHTKIPLGQLANSEHQLLSELETEMKKTIIGQDEQLSVVANLIRRARTNIADPNKPLASFMFLGPSGVGKTETAKTIARTLYHDSDSFIRVDMSEFAEGFTVSRLLGAPAGYVGYRDGNKFTDLVRKRPYSVVLLDEIEKAHSDIFNILLQVLEDGQLTDATGRTINFKNTIIIMTSNVGHESFVKAAGLGFSESGSNQTTQSVRNKVLESLKDHFRPEFLNRVDATVVFNSLIKTDIETIAGQHAAQLARRLFDQGIELEITDQALKHVAEKGFSAESGARGIRRIFQDAIESEIAIHMLKHLDSSGLNTMRSITVDIDNGKLTFNPR